MAKYVSIVNHENRNIIYVNCADQGPAEMIAAMDEMLEEVLKQPKGEKVLILMDMQNTPSSMAVNQRGREIVEIARTNGIPDMPTAIVGFTGPQKIITRMFAGMRRPDTLYVADTVEDAKDWLSKR